MSIELFNLTGRRALVTGSTRGIGRALADGLAAAGATVVLNGRADGAVSQAVAELQASGHLVEGAAFDVRDTAAVNQAVDRIEASGPIDILINNAGIQRRAPLAEVEDELWQEVIDTNLTAVFKVGRAVARPMLARGRGKIVNICSLMSRLGRATTGPYTAAKGGVQMLTQAMCTEWAGRGIQANGIGPGYFATELNQPLVEDPKFDGWLRHRTPAGRWGEVSELVGAAIFLSSDASNFVNGQIIYVDGGVLAAL